MTTLKIALNRENLQRVALAVVAAAYSRLDLAWDVE
jgi:hypothetical protein